MTRGFAFLPVIAMAALLPAAPLAAQDTQPAPPPPSPSRTYSLPPGNPVDRPPPEPEAQGPSGPDSQAPRVIRPGGQGETQTPSRTQPTPQVQIPRVAPTQPGQAPSNRTQQLPQRQTPVAPNQRGVIPDDLRRPAPMIEPEPGAELPEVSDEELFDDPEYEGAPATDSETPAVTAAPEDSGGFAWWWLIVAGALAAFAGFVLLRRHRAAAGAEIAEPEPLFEVPSPSKRQDAPEAEREAATAEEPDVAPEPDDQPVSEPDLSAAPVVNLPPQPAQQPAPAPTPRDPLPAAASPFVSTRIPGTAPRPQAPPPIDPNDTRPVRVHMDFQPLEARMDDDGLSIVYRVIIENVSNEDLTDIAIDIFIRSADAAAAKTRPEQPLRAFEQKKLAARTRLEHRGEVRLAPNGFQPMQSDGKAMLVPVVDLLPKYRDGVGKMHEVHLAMLIGRENDPPTERMAPFWLDGKQGRFAPIGCRPLAQNVLHDEAA